MLGMKNSDEMEKADREDLASSLNANQGEVRAETDVDLQEKSEKLESSVGAEKLKDELESERRKNDDLVKQMKYLQADLVNLQRQSDRMLVDVRNQARFSLILELISVKEDLDRAVEAANLTSNKKADLIEGLKLLTAKIDGTLRAEDVSNIPAEIGSKMDPRLHEAVSTKAAKDFEEGTILSVIGRGYMINGKVVKPVLVEVAMKEKPALIKDDAKSEDQTNQETSEKKQDNKNESA